MQALPRPVTEPRLAARQVTLAPVPDLGPAAVGSDALVTEQDVAHLALACHASEFVEFASVRVAGGTLADSDWYRTNWVDVALSCLDAANAAFTESGLKRIDWESSRLTGFSASGCTLEDVAHRTCGMTMSNFRFANLQRVDFDDCDLSGADFTGARLTDVTFTDCILAGAQFHQAQCHRVVVSGGTLAGIRGLAGLRGTAFRLDGLDEIAAEMAVELGFHLVEP